MYADRKGNGMMKLHFHVLRATCVIALGNAIRRAAIIFPPAVSGFFALSRTVNYWAMSPSLGR